MWAAALFYFSFQPKGTFPINEEIEAFDVDTSMHIYDRLKGVAFFRYKNFVRTFCTKPHINVCTATAMLICSQTSVFFSSLTLIVCMKREALSTSSPPAARRSRQWLMLNLVFLIIYFPHVQRPISQRVCNFKLLCLQSQRIFTIVKSDFTKLCLLCHSQQDIL